jgi:hypothetical protein
MKPTISRRAFLRSLPVMTGAFLAACGPPRSTAQPMRAFGPQATPQIVLPSPTPHPSRQQRISPWRSSWRCQRS